ncbi:MAG TPA: flippase-like domain-containing protein [Solirubrobacteraceae bacterium]|nr:flippase-like domain-containing protein [Solirubrobacteraceae bacterium]
MASRPTVEYIPPPEALPDEFSAPRLRRRALQVAALLAVVGLIAWLAPGLGEVRERLSGARPEWLALAVVLELLSCLSYILMFKPVFCRRMTWRTTYELGMSALGAGSLVPASGAAGLALGAWALRKSGMAGAEIARHSVAFFVLKSGANFVAVAVVGAAMWLGVGPQRSVFLTLVPALLALATIGLVACVPAIAVRLPREEYAGRRWQRWLSAIAGALDQGVREAGTILRRRDWKVILGSLGYWAFDNAVLWACFKAFGESPAITLVLMGYLIGQLGGLLPIPGGIGGIDGGLIGALIVYGLPAAATAAAVLAYRVILFWLPLVLGAAAFSSLRRGLEDPERSDLCDPLRRPPRRRRAAAA